MENQQTYQQYIADLIIDQCKYLGMDPAEQADFMYGNLLAELEIYCQSGLILFDRNRTDIKRFHIGTYFKYAELKSGEIVPLNKFHA